jgi:hypothetical protein
LLASPVSLDGAIDGRAGDAEQIPELGSAVVAGAMQRDEMRLLARVGLGLLAAQERPCRSRFGLRDGARLSDRCLAAKAAVLVRIGYGPPERRDVVSTVDASGGVLTM